MKEKINPTPTKDSRIINRTKVKSKMTPYFYLFNILKQSHFCCIFKYINMNGVKNDSILAYFEFIKINLY